MKPKKSLVNLSLDSDFLNIIKEESNSRGFEKVSDYIQDWFKKLSLERKDIKRVVLQIPEMVLADKQKLEAWLAIRSAGIVSHFFKE